LLDIAAAGVVVRRRRAYRVHGGGMQRRREEGGGRARGAGEPRLVSLVFWEGRWGPMSGRLWVDSRVRAHSQFNTTRKRKSPRGTKLQERDNDSQNTQHFTGVATFGED